MTAMQCHARMACVALLLSCAASASAVEAACDGPDAVVLHPAAQATADARAFLAWRKTQPALVEGAIRFVDAPPQVLAFVREHAGQRLLVAFNLSAAAVEWSLPMAAKVLPMPGVDPAQVDGNRLRFPARGGACAMLG